MALSEEQREAEEHAMLTGFLVGKLVGSGITAFIQVDEDTGYYTDEVKIVLHDGVYEPITVTVKVI